MAKLRAEHGGAPFAINYYEASPDGSRVGVGVSAGGSEAAQLNIYDAATGAQVAGPIDRTDFGGLSWTDDAKTLFFLRLQKTDNPQLKYFNVTDEVWDLKSAPRDVLGAPVKESVIKVPPVMGAGVGLTPGSDVALAVVQNGVQNEIEVWTGPVAKAGDPAAPWSRLATREDDITSGAVRGEDIWLLSHKDAPTFKVLHVKAGQPLSSADVALAAQAGRLVESIHAAADGLYVRARQGVYSQLLFIPVGGGPREIGCRPRVRSTRSSPIPAGPGRWSSSKAGPFRSPFTPMTRRRAASPICAWAPSRDYDDKAYVATDLKARAADGAEVPMTYVAKVWGDAPGRRADQGVRVIRNFPIFHRSTRAPSPFSTKAGPGSPATCAAAESWARPGDSAARTPTSPTPGGTSSPAERPWSPKATPPRTSSS